MPKFSGTVRINVPYYTEATVTADNAVAAAELMLANTRKDLDSGDLGVEDFEMGTDISAPIIWRIPELEGD